MSIASDLGLTPRPNSIASRVGLAPNSSPATNTNTSGSNITNILNRPSSVANQIGLAPNSSPSAGYVPSTSSSTSSTSRSRSSSSRSRSSSNTGAVTSGDQQNVSPSSGYIQQEIKYEEPKVSKNNDVPSYSYSGVVDYSGVKQLPNESKTAFETRVQSMVQSRASSEAQRLSSTNKGTEINVNLSYTSPLYKEYPSNVAKNQPPKNNNLTGSPMVKSPEFVIKIPSDNKKQRNDPLIATGFGASFPSEQRFAVGGAQPADPKLTSWTSKVIRGVDKFSPVSNNKESFDYQPVIGKTNYKYDAPSTLEKGSNMRALAIEERFKRVSGLDFAGFALDKVKAVGDFKPKGTEDLVYSRSGEFIGKSLVSAGKEFVNDPVKYGALYGLSGAGAKVVSYGGGVVSGVPVVAKFISNPLVKKGGTAVVYGAGGVFAGVGAFDVASSNNPSGRAGVILAESFAITKGITSVNYKGSFESGRRVTQGLFFKSKPSDIVKFDYASVNNFVVVKPNNNAFAFVDEGAGVLSQRTTQRNLFGELVGESDLAKSVVLQSRVTPMGLKSGVTWSKSNMPVLDSATFSIPEGRGFRYITETGTGKSVNLDPFKFGTRTKSLPEFGIDQSKVTVLDVKTGGLLEVSPRGYESLLLKDSARFSFFGASDPRGVSSVKNVVKSESQKSLLDSKLFALPVPVLEFKGLSQSFNVGATRLSGASSNLVQSQLVSKNFKSFAVPSPVSIFEKDASVISTNFNVGGVVSSSVFTDSLSSSKSKVESKSVVGVAFKPELGLSSGVESGVEPVVGVRSGTGFKSKNAFALDSSLVTETVQGSVIIPITGSDYVPIKETRFNFIPDGGGTRPLPPPAFIPVPFIPSGSSRGFSRGRGVSSGSFPAWKTARAGKAFLTSNVITLRSGGLVNDVSRKVSSVLVVPKKKKKKEFWWESGFKL